MCFSFQTYLQFPFQIVVVQHFLLCIGRLSPLDWCPEQFVSPAWKNQDKNHPIFLFSLQFPLLLQIYPQTILMMQNIAFSFQSKKWTCLSPYIARVWLLAKPPHILVSSSNSVQRFQKVAGNSHHKVPLGFYLQDSLSVPSCHLGTAFHNWYKLFCVHYSKYPIRKCVDASFLA